MEMLSNKKQLVLVRRKFLSRYDSGGTRGTGSETRLYVESVVVFTCVIGATRV